VTTVTLVTALGIPEGAQPHPGMASGGIASLHKAKGEEMPFKMTISSVTPTTTI